MEYEVTIPSWFTELKKIPMFEHAVIAGGYLRDQVFQKWNKHYEVKDVDIFFPVVNDRQYFKDINNAWPKMVELGFVQEGKGKVYEKAGLTSQLNVSVKGQDVDLMAMNMYHEQFGQNLVEGFPWANQQIYHDGEKLHTTEKFRNDMEHFTMTLVNCNSLIKIPTLMEKYQRLHETFPELMFKTDYVLTKRKGDDWL